ncbi:MAG: hypothetical protein KBD46_03450 [Candidatus Levybacteria bacterium]|nr:hypothetical protein [Candidatus Levybacteria bacterium]
MAKIFEDELLNDVANVTLGAAAGFALFWAASHEKSPLKAKLPEKRIKNISILPNIKISRKEKDIHLHHWFNIASVYGFLYWKKRNMLGNKLLNGFLMGSIFQGLSYKDRFSFIYKPQDKLSK